MLFVLDRVTGDLRGRYEDGSMDDMGLKEFFGVACESARVYVSCVGACGRVCSSRFVRERV